jgi:N-acetyl-gamma-glutamyl-phosphate reductase
MNIFPTIEAPVADAVQPQKSTTRPVPQVAVLGVSGFAGGELARLLLNHPRLNSTAPQFYSRAVASEDAKATRLTDIHPNLLASPPVDHPVVPFSWDRIRESGTSLLFLATPHEQSRELVPDALARGLRIIDLSGAWRLKETANRDVYKLVDANPELAAEVQTDATYGCPELHRDAISGARVVANPGCYATSIILALAPLVQAKLVDLDRGIVCDSKSGVSGAGKAATAKTHFMYAADNLSAYSVFGHRHTGELLEQLGLDSSQIRFTPHLLPIPRGILSTVYLRLKETTDSSQISACYQEFYRHSPMVRLRGRGHLPQIQFVTRTNYCDIGFELGPDGRSLVIVSCLDNLLKGAAGQAVQNMNVMYGWNESEGLL